MSKHKQPWYRNFISEFCRASQYILTYEANEVSPDFNSLQNFENETLARFIFESNYLEHEGLSLGETRELVISEIPNLEGFARFLKGELPVDIRALARPLQISRYIRGFELHVLAKYGARSREALTVARHLIACTKAATWAQEVHLSRFLRSTFYQLQNDVASGDQKQLQWADKFRARYFPDGKVPKRKVLLSEARLKELHRRMARGLIGKGQSPAGQYRKHPVMTDLESHYPAPEDVPAAMKRFVRQFRLMEIKEVHPISLATWASSQLVLIHPFGDFNGRLSRLLINMILRSHGLPFFTSFSSSKRERQRYLSALRRYRRGDRTAIATLISMQVNENFDNLNAVLELSGQTKIDVPTDAQYSETPTNENLVELKWPLRLPEISR